LQARSRNTKKPLVAKLRAARERKRQAIGKCEGRKNWAEINPELVREAKRLRRRSPKGHQRSLRDVAAELAKLGFVNQSAWRRVVGILDRVDSRIIASCEAGWLRKRAIQAL
jgi:hypothetical protein